MVKIAQELGTQNRFDLFFSGACFEMKTSQRIYLQEGPRVEIIHFPYAMKVLIK